MAVLTAQFQPGAPAGQLAEQALSWMDRSQQRKLQQEQLAIQQAEEARRQQQYEVLEPVLAAKAQADILSAQDQLQAAKGVQALRVQYLPRVQQGRDEFGQLALIDDPTQRAKAANTWIGKYAPLASLSEFKNEFDTYLHHATGFNQDDMKLAVLQQTIDARAKLAADANAARTETATIRADADRYKTETAEAGRNERAKLHATTAQILVREKLKSNDPQELNQRAMELEAEAQALTDPNEIAVLTLSAKQLRDKAVKLTSRAENPFDAVLTKAFGVPPPATQPAGQAPAAAGKPTSPQQIQDITKSIKF